jgi:hypothetical protein
MANYIEYNTEVEALEKAEQEGIAQNLPHWQDAVNVTKYVTAPFYTTNGKWALEVTDYTTLTEAEIALIVNELIVDGLS